MKDFSYITNASPAFIENMYQDFVKDPKNVDPEFRKFFEGFDFAISNIKPQANGNGAAVAPRKETVPAPPVGEGEVDWMREVQVYRMILGYRNKGHLIAKTNPIRERKDRGANLELSFFGFTEDDLDKTFYAGNLLGLGKTSLRNIIQYLKNCYASNVGIEFKYISDQKKIDFLTREMENAFLTSLMKV
jgi:2-oxoglutarate dehydrogenase E1 component